jgi:hypothetical protein
VTPGRPSAFSLILDLLTRSKTHKHVKPESQAQRQFHLGFFVTQ